MWIPARPRSWPKRGQDGQPVEGSRNVLRALCSRPCRGPRWATCSLRRCLPTMRGQRPRHRQQGGGEVSVADVAHSPNARINSRQGAAASAPGGPRAAEGRIDAPASTSVVAASRRDVSVLDDPDVADSQEHTASTGRKASRNRQLDLDVGVADLSVGNAADRNDNDVPAQSLAVNPSASATQKQMPGGTTGNTTGQDALRPALGSQNEPPAGQLAARAEVVDAAAGEPTVGGGTTSLPRVGRGPMVEATTQADVAEIAGAIASSGKPNAEPRSSDRRLCLANRNGTQCRTGQRAVGSKESAMLAATPETAAPGTGAARREGAAADQPGPVFRDATYAGGPGRSSPHIQLPSSAATVALDDEPSSPREATAAGSDAALIAGAPGSGADEQIGRGRAAGRYPSADGSRGTRRVGDRRCRVEWPPGLRNKSGYPTRDCPIRAAPCRRYAGFQHRGSGADRVVSQARDARRCCWCSGRRGRSANGRGHRAGTGVPPSSTEAGRKLVAGQLRATGRLAANGQRHGRYRIGAAGLPGGRL